MKGGGALLALALTVAGPSTAHAQDALKFSGSFKSLASRSRTLAGEGYLLDLNRLRLQWQGAVARSLAVDLQYDNELLLGSYLRTDQFRLQKDEVLPQYWRAEANYLDSGDAYGRHRLYRASAIWSAGAVDVKLGRQRVAWGTGRFWSPLDIVNPVSPVALEREERAGVDALLVEGKLGALSRLSMLVAPRRGEPADRALQWHGNTHGVDYSLVAGRLASQDVIGADMATQAGEAGLRGEITRQKPADRPAFNRVVVGLDYAFANTLTITAELFYNGAGARDPMLYDVAGFIAGRQIALATRYAGLFASYEITPLLKWSGSAVFNADDHSRALELRLAWSVASNLELAAGAQRFSGSGGSEFRRLPNVWFGQVQWFF